MKRTIKGLCICAVMTTALALQAADAGTTYLKLDAGLSIIDKLEPKDAGPDSEDADMDPGVRVDVAGGYNFAKGFALELEAGLAYNEGKDVDLDFYQIPLIATSFLAITRCAHFLVAAFDEEALLPWSWWRMLVRALLVAVFAFPLFRLFDAVRKLAERSVPSLSGLRLRADNRRRRQS